MFYVVPSDVARNRSDGVETHSAGAAGEAEAAGTLRFFIFYDTGLGAVAGFLHQIENIHAVAELYVNAGAHHCMPRVWFAVYIVHEEEWGVV